MISMPYKSQKVSDSTYCLQSTSSYTAAVENKQNAAPLDNTFCSKPKKKTFFLYLFQSFGLASGFSPVCVP